MLALDVDPEDTSARLKAASSEATSSAEEHVGPDASSAIALKPGAEPGAIIMIAFAP